MEHGTYLTVAEAAAEVGTDERALYDAIVEGTLDARQEEGHWVIARAALADYWDQPMNRICVGEDARDSTPTAERRRDTHSDVQVAAGVFPNVHSKTRLFPGLRFLEALELVVDQAGLAVTGSCQS